MPPKNLSAHQRARYEAAFAAENAALLRDNPKGDARTRWNYQRYIVNYLPCIAGVDRNIGRVLEHLDTTGLAKKHNRHHGVRTLTHKLIYYDAMNAWELFDLVKDPNEMQSIHAELASQSVFNSLRGELSRLRIAAGDNTGKPLPTGQ